MIDSLAFLLTIESILTSNTSTWHGNSTMQDWKALEGVVRSAERTTGPELTVLSATVREKALHLDPEWHCLCSVHVHAGTMGITTPMILRTRTVCYVGTLM